jgi:hypothetical protein
MNIKECFETGSFNEMIQFSFDEVRAAFNLNKYFVLDEHGEEFISEAIRVKNWYNDELNQIESYSQGEYTSNINLGIEIPDYDTPQFKVKAVETQAKRKLIQLITKYFNQELFQINKPFIYGHECFKEEPVETLHEMLVALNVNKSKLYSLLSILGYYQRNYGYFLSRADFLSICYNYSNQVYVINKRLGMEYRFVNIFLSSGRIKPPKKRKSSGSVDSNIDNVISEQYQSTKFIDIDKISLLMLVQPYLKNNTQEVCKIIEIMMWNFKKYRGMDAWGQTMAEVRTFIAECEAKGIMKRVL